MSICSIWRHRHADTEHWFPKVFINCGLQTPEIREEIDYIRRTSGHCVSLPVTMKPRQEIFDKHPDWFSQLNGKRDIKGIAGCWSNEGFYNYTVSNLIKRIRDNNAVVANFFVADIMQRCECEECTKNPDKSARWWNYYAKLIEGIRKEIPDMHFAGLAYQEYRAIPSVKVKSLDQVDYCQYNRCYYHELGDTNCAMNVRSMKEFRGWAEQAPLGLYGYEFDVFSPHVYLPLWRVIADEMRVFKKMDLRRVKTEYGVNLNRLSGTRKSPALPPPQIGQLASRLSYYAWAMAAFDPDLDMDALIDDFCRHVYGPRRRGDEGLPQSDGRPLGRDEEPCHVFRQFRAGRRGQVPHARKREGSASPSDCGGGGGERRRTGVAGDCPRHRLPRHLGNLREGGARGRSHLRPQGVP
jgi:hypothetical protein